MALFPPAPGGGQSVAHGYKGKGVIIHLLVDRQGHPIAATSTDAKGDEREQIASLLDRMEPLLNKERSILSGKMPIVEADKGYDARKVRQMLLNRGFFPGIPFRQFKKPQADRPRFKEVLDFFGFTSCRWVVERTFSWIKRQSRRLLMRWERLHAIWEAILSLSIIHYWIRNLLG